MCGINAIFRYGSVTEEDRQTVHRMNREMIYRGPDDEGIWSDERATLGMRRLAIIGVENGRQPLFNEDRSLVLICNGEIYNYRRLRADLEKKGHRFYSESDCEAILYLYEEKGVDCLSDLRGMFAIVLWDSKNRTLFAARDPVGEKPLYFAETPGGVVFSSELKAINRHVLPSGEVNWNIIRQIMEYTYPVDMRNTFIHQIKRLLPGEYAVTDDNGVRLQKYWKASFEPTYPGSLENAREDFLNLLKESIDMRFESEVPVAVMLSGGIDSSAVAVLSALSQRDVNAITIGYRGQPDCDERDMARSVAEAMKINWKEIELDTEDFETYFDDYIKVLDEPVADPVCIPQWGIYQKARKLGFKVLLNGTGGDELFFGYPYHNLTARHLHTHLELERYLPLKEETVEGFGEFFSSAFHKSSTKGRYLFLDALAYLKPFKDYWKTIPFEWPDSLSFRDPDPLNGYRHEADNGFDQLSAVLFSTWLPGNCLHISDKLGMGNSVEVRAPFVDHKLVEFVFSLPVEWRYSENHSKPFLKQALRGIVPDVILDAPKRGFTTPDSFIRRITRKKGNGMFPGACFHTVVIENVLSLHLSGADKTGLDPRQSPSVPENQKMSSAAAANQIGEERFGKGDLKGALDALRTAVILDPLDAAAYNNLGVVYWRKGEIGEALACFSKALESDPDHPDALQNSKDALKAVESEETTETGSLATCSPETMVPRPSV